MQVHTIEPIPLAKEPDNFYIYENIIKNHYMKIHLGNCSFCNNGEGIHRPEVRKGDAWHGPYESYGDALDAAKGSCGNIEDCEYCKPHLKGKGA
jgi:hypothetical protein